MAFASEAELLHAIERILAPLGRRVDEASPLCDARLADGSRVNVIVPPLSLTGPCLTIRRFRSQGFSLADLVSNGTLAEPAADLLSSAVEGRASILVSGGTGAGKTTTLNALSGAIPEGERIVTIEDAAELALRGSHVVRLEARPPNLEGRGEVTIRQLVRNALRMRPDRIVVGEVRGGEALDLLQALNTGHDGSLSTVHANSPADALRRIETLALMAGVGLPARGGSRAACERRRPDRAPGAQARRLARRRVRGRGASRAAVGRPRGSCSRAAGSSHRPRAGWRVVWRPAVGSRPPGRRSPDGRGRARLRRGCAADARAGRARGGLGRADRGGWPARLRDRRPRWPTSSCVRAARDATPERPSGDGCSARGPCWPSLVGALLAGPLAGLALGAGGPWLVARVLRARREHYRRAVEAGAADLCVVLADALGAGHSLRSALASAADGLTGAAGHELRRVAAELRAGGRTEDALEAMRLRVGSAPIDTVVAACLVQHRAGGDLAGSCASVRRRSATRRGWRARSAAPRLRPGSPA